ncbi:COG0606 Predicted ATPase with chaperone activity [Burkholderiales bacterium]
MSIATVASRSLSGLTTSPVRVEVDLSPGLPNLIIVGLPSTAVREARERVRAAIQNAGFSFPSARRVTVNLAPADLPKDSGRFDLAIALGILAAEGQIPPDALQGRAFAGELSLSGDLLPIRAGFVFGLSALAEPGLRQLVLPAANARELARLEAGDRIVVAAHLAEVVAALKGEGDWQSVPMLPAHAAGASARPAEDAPLAWEDIQGQAEAKRAALVAAAGGHRLLLVGPPGVGKSMVAQRMPSLLPPLSAQAACTVAALQSLQQGTPVEALADWGRPPYRAPHHSISMAALIGGGQPIRPGELSLAHGGVLFLDELPEFNRAALEALREPLETGEVRVARVHDRQVLPAAPLLVAAMNPCPCGFYGANHLTRHCACSPDQVARYRGRLSGPLLDRFDLAVQLAWPSATRARAEAQAYAQASGHAPPSAEDVARAHARAMDRQGCLNAALPVGDLRLHAPLQDTAQRLLAQSAEHLGWSLRVQHRLTRVARTVADLADLPDGAPLGVSEVAAAISLRRALDPPAALRAG